MVGCGGGERGAGGGRLQRGERQLHGADGRRGRGAGHGEDRIADLAFEPSTLTVASGSTTITVTNSDTVTHTFTLDDGSVDETIDPGQSVEVTVNITATTGFHCSIHTTMTGTLQVA